MELKKTNTANLDKKRTLFFEIGLLVALGIVFAAFEWGTTNRTDLDNTVDRGIPVEVDIAPVVMPEPEKKTPPAVMPDVIVLTDNDLPGSMDPIFLDAGGDIPLLTTMGTYVPFVDTTDVVSEEFEVDIQAQFMGGGTDKFLKWVMQNVTYPEIARSNGVGGKVYVSFVIDKKGDLTKIKILRNVDQSLVDETVSVLNKSPKWTPAIKKGKVTSVQYQMPVNFKLE